MKGMNRFSEKVQRFCIRAVWLVVLCIVGIFAAAGLFTHSKLRSMEVIVHAPASPLLQLGAGVLMILLLAGLTAVIGRNKRLRITVITVWAFAAAWFAYHVDIRQVMDFETVCGAAQRFAVGSYHALEGDYFHACSYQLGTCLMLEIVCRLLPGISLELFMRVANAVMSGATMLILTGLGGVVCGDQKAESAASAMYLLCLTVPLYCVYVYGTIPMMFLCACAFLCFALYVRRRAVWFGLGWVILAAVAYMIKPNAAIALAALVICAVVDVLVSRDKRMFLFALLAVVLSVGLSRGAVMQYEIRSGIKLRENVSMISRLTMGLQESWMGAGWYNDYINQFFPAEVTAEMEREIASADLKARVGELAGDPGMATSFFGRKAGSQWLEPTYSTLNYGYNQKFYWPENEQAPWVLALYEQDGRLRLALEGIMKAWQQALYMLAAIGLLYNWKRADDAAWLLLPLVVLGGFLYHMIFEAKSQYIYVYMVYLVPVAAQGLCEAEKLIRMTIGRMKER